MSTETLHLNIDRADGSLQRLIGLVERRGFHIDGMTLSDEGHAVMSNWPCAAATPPAAPRPWAVRSTSCSASPASPARPRPSIPR
jgi:hypothetical protein